MLKGKASTNTRNPKTTVLYAALTVVFLVGLVVAINNKWQIPTILNISQHIVLAMLALFIWNVAFIRYYAMHKRLDLILSYAYLGVFIFTCFQLIGFAFDNNRIVDWFDIFERIWLPIVLLLIFPAKKVRRNLWAQIKNDKLILYIGVMLIIAFIGGMVANIIKHDTHSEIIELLNIASLVATAILFTQVNKYNNLSSSRLLGSLKLSVLLLIMAQLVYSFSLSGFSSSLFYAELIEIASYLVLAYGLLINVVEAFQYEDQARLVLKNKNNELKTLDALKDDFIATASHQLRTPSASVHDALRMLNHPDMSKKDRDELIALAEASSEHLVTVVRTMLNMARIQAGHFTIDASEAEMIELTKKVISQVKILADQKGSKIELMVPNQPILMQVDTAKISEALSNYIENAIKYSPDHSAIMVSLTESDEKLYFEVADQGMGVPIEERQNLFGKFYRAANARQEQPDGNGIGLYVVRSIAEGHGGAAYYRPADETGSVFGFWLPQKQGQKA